MVRFNELLIDTPYALADIEDRRASEDTSMCTYCGVRTGDPTYDVRDVVVVRRWKRNSAFLPDAAPAGGGGRFEWRCPNHPFEYSSSPHAENAPLHLRPSKTMRCEEMTLGRRCESRTGQRYDRRWLCEEHAEGIVRRLQVEERLRELDESIDDT